LEIENRKSLHPSTHQLIYSFTHSLFYAKQTQFQNLHASRHRPNTQTVQILPTTFTQLCSTFTQKYPKKRELFHLFTRLRRTFLYFFQTFYAKQTQFQSAIYPSVPGLIYSSTHPPIYAKQSQFAKSRDISAVMVKGYAPPLSSCHIKAQTS
jgi:hypothetical protein